MRPALAVGLGLVLGFIIVSRPGVKAAVGDLMLPARPCPGCKGGGA